LLATTPVFLAGFFGRDFISSYFRDIEIIAWATIGFGVLLWVADQSGLTIRRVEHLSIWNAFFIGLAQVLALIPGTSRSGITMTAGRFLGLERAAAARFSLLLSIPTILGAGVLSGLELLESSDFQPSEDVLLAMGLSFIVGLLSIAAMMRWLTHAGFTPFVIYRILLGGGLLYWIYT
jgi:undecaprenyl-diphosphatase